MRPPGEHELDVFADWERAAWEQRAASWAASLEDLTRGSVAALLDAAAVRAGLLVLDVGTGAGVVARAAAARGAVVCGVDASTALAAIARRAGTAAVVASVEHLPFAGGTYDAVVGGYLLNHLARPELAVGELHRVLRPGGRLALTVWDVPDANAALGLFGPVTAEVGLPDRVPPGPDAQRFAADDELHGLLDGWADVRVTRLRWTVTVDPGAWFDAVADATPRTGAVLEQASPQQRVAARERYVADATAAYRTADGQVALPAAAVVGSATRR